MTTSDYFIRGQSHGWDAANYAEAYGRDESVAREAARRSRDVATDPADRSAYRWGFVSGYEHFQRGEWSDGQPRDDNRHVDCHH